MKPEKRSTYSELGNSNQLDINEMFSLKGGLAATTYGCESNVCAIDRSGAKDLCTDAYCRSGVGSTNPGEIGEH